MTTFFFPLIGHADSIFYFTIFFNKLSKINLSCPLMNHLAVSRSTSTSWCNFHFCCLSNKNAGLSLLLLMSSYFALTSERAAFPLSSLWCLIDFTIETVTNKGEMQIKDKRDALDFHYVQQRRVRQVCTHFKTSGYKKNKKQIREFSSWKVFLNLQEAIWGLHLKFALTKQRRKTLNNSSVSEKNCGLFRSDGFLPGWRRRCICRKLRETLMMADLSRWADTRRGSGRVWASS